MIGNLTNTVLSLLDTLPPAAADGATERLRIKQIREHSGRR